MTRHIRALVLSAVVVTCLGLLVAPAHAKIDGVSGTTFDFTATSGYIQASDGNTILVWGYALGDGKPQYPGPTLIVNQGDTISITLHNDLPEPVSIVFPGQEGVIAAGGQPGLLTNEAPTGDSVSYTFIAAEAGTYMYYSGSRPELQVEMGLVGALIVRPTGFDPVTNRIAYNYPGTDYDYEYLFLLSEMDDRIHEMVEAGQMGAIDNVNWFPYYWFINGRNAPDTMSEAFSDDLPLQPYNCVPRTHPGDKVLMRIIGAGRDMHPFHHHGNNSTLIAKDGRLVARNVASGPDLATSYFTIPSWPGSTYDALWDPWTGKGLGWDIYGDPAENGHTCGPADDVSPADGYHDVTWEYCADHGKELPTVLNDDRELTFGSFYSGSPFLGSMGSLPPGGPGFNVNGGLAFMWHSHNEKELTSNDIFPGGMFTMMIIEPHGVDIEQ